MDNKRIKVTELDFDTIKSNLKEYLKGQTEFSDYDFEGSALSTLIDVLAYNTHYNAMYAHLAVNEAFLDSAAKRNSVVSHAKSLGYVPYSAKAARAVVNIVVTNPSGTPDTLTLPTNSEFTTSIDGVTYTFYNRSAMTVNRDINSSTEYAFQNVEITEGTILRNRYEVSTGVQYIIPNQSVDLSTLVVTVQESSSTPGYTTYTLADNFTLLTSSDTVYFVKEIDDELYEVYFGDGITGKQLNAGNIVTLSYMVCNKDAPNKASSFTFNGSIGGGTVVVFGEAAAGGSDIESIDSIKLNAPRSYSAQNRAVTAEDYKTLLPQLYPNIDSLNVWGGENNIPPAYGKVFISIKPKFGETLNYTAKEYIKNNLLSKKNVVAVQPILVDPEYVYISLLSDVYYNPLKTDKSDETIRSLILNTIIQYDKNELRQFGGLFRYSKLSRLIDLSDTSITSNITNIRIAKQLTPSFGTDMKYTISYGNPIYNEGAAEEAVRSTGFYVLGYESTLVYLDDNGAGKLRMFYLDESNNKLFVYSNIEIGTVDYTSGTIILNNTFTIISAPNNKITIYCVPESNDILSTRNQLVIINQQEIKVNVLVDKVSSGQYFGSSNYTFSSSHNYKV